MNIKTSVVLCTYNGKEYIVEQLDSLRDQTMKIEEVVICDDRSSDGTVDIVNKYISDNGLENWSIEVNEKNLGYESNFFKALNKSHGEYVFFSDQDDIWRKDKIEIMVKLMEQDKNIKLLCSEFEIFKSSEVIPENTGSYGKDNKNDKSLEKIEMNPYNIFIRSLGCDMGVRRSFIEDIRPYWFEGWAQDEYVWKLALCGDGCYVYHEPLIRHRVPDHNVSMHKIHEINKRIVHLEKLKKGNEKCKEYVEKHSNNPEYIKLLDKNIRSEELRIDMLKNGKIFNTFPLLAYKKYYYSPKSLLMEPYIAIKEHRKVSR